MKTPEIQTLEHDAASIEEKLTANKSALDAARNAKHLATALAAEDASAENMEDLRAATLEVDALEAVRKELDRRALFVARELKSAREVALLEHNQRELQARLAAYTARRDAAFELRDQLALMLQFLPDLCHEFNFLRVEEMQISNAADGLNLSGELDFRQVEGEGMHFVWKTRDLFTGTNSELEKPFQAILQALTRQAIEGQTHDFDAGRLDLMREKSSSYVPKSEEWPEVTSREEALANYQKGDRSRASQRAHSLLMDEQRQIEVDAENAQNARAQVANVQDVRLAYQQQRKAA